jgi:hypothetical protein
MISICEFLTSKKATEVAVPVPTTTATPTQEGFQNRVAIFRR